MRIALILALAASSLFAAGPHTAGAPGTAAVLPAGFTDTTVLSTFEGPTAVRFAPDGRVFVAEKRGVIKVFDNLADTTPSTFADLRTNVYNFWDRGLLGLALDPAFPTNPYVYVLYTLDAPIGGTPPVWGTPNTNFDPCPDPPGAVTNGCVVAGRLSRFRANGNVAGPEQVLIEDWCQQFPSHSIGALNFGPDGALYLSGGDGANFNEQDYGQFGSPLNPCGDPPTGIGGHQTPPTAQGGALRSQDLLTTADPMGLDGTILRVDPATGAALADNPLASSPDPNTRRVIAHGVRNPFRFTFRPGTSELWIDDVGWGQWEELDFLAAPLSTPVENFGWPCYEGNDKQGGYDVLDLATCEGLYGTPGAVVAPWFTYRHNDQVVDGEECSQDNGSAIAGLAFYGAGTYPDIYQGALFLSDYTRRCIWMMRAGPDGRPDPSTVTTFDHPAGGPVDLQIGPGGDLYAVDFDLGLVHRYQYFSDNVPPAAVLSASPTNGTVPLHVDFDGSSSSDPDGEALTYEWDLDGDGVFDDGSDPTESRVYTEAGTVTASLRVTDPSGEQSTASVVLSPGNTAPTASILTPGASTHWSVGEAIAFSGKAQDPDEGNLPATAYHWEAVIHHCPSHAGCHTHDIAQIDGVKSGTFPGPDHDYPSYLTITLTVTDAGGLTASDSVDIYPNVATLELTANLSGIRLSVGPSTKKAPIRTTVILGSTQTVTAPSPQSAGGTTYVFSSWSDGGAASHSVVVDASRVKLRAIFVPLGLF